MRLAKNESRYIGKETDNVPLGHYQSTNGLMVIHVVGHK